MTNSDVTAQHSPNQINGIKNRISDNNGINKNGISVEAIRMSMNSKDDVDEDNEGSERSSDGPSSSSSLSALNNDSSNEENDKSTQKKKVIILLFSFYLCRISYFFIRLKTLPPFTPSYFNNFFR